MTSAVLFDFYGTIATAESWPDTPDAVLARHGYSLPPDVRSMLARELSEGLDHHGHSSDRERYVEWDRQRLRCVIDACGVPPARATSIVEEVWRARRPAALRVYPEAGHAVASLRARGIAIGLCSNWDWDLDQDLERIGLGGSFDLVVSSARAGARKPHERIYRYALGLLGLPPNEVLFVGDTLLPDVEGPMRLGMRAAYLQRNSHSPWPGLGAWGGSHGSGGHDETGRKPVSAPDGVPCLADLLGLSELIEMDGAARHR
jgi:putative hydrolase of the HAD superfamily